MQKDIHPKLTLVKITCSCGHSFETHSTLDKPELLVEVCMNCHPFYTGKHKVVDTSGRVERFRDKYKKKQDNAAAG